MKCDVGLMIDCDVAEKKNENQLGMSSYNTKLHTLITPTSHNFQPYISFFGQILKLQRLKIVASGCDQCVWAVGVVAGHGH